TLRPRADPRLAARWSSCRLPPVVVSVPRVAARSVPRTDRRCPVREYFSMRRLHSAWSMYRVPAMGTGLPLFTCVIAFVLVRAYGLHPGLWVLLCIVAGQVEAWTFHSKDGALDLIKRPAGMLWGGYGFFGILFSGIFLKEPCEFSALIATHAGVASFFLCS